MSAAVADLVSTPAGEWRNALTPWSRCLDLAGVHDPQLRQDYTTLNRYLRRRERAGWLAARALAPAHHQAHVIAGGALVHFTDDVHDRAPAGQQGRNLALWTARMREAMDSGRSQHPMLRAYLHSAQACGLSLQWALDHAAGVRLDTGFAGFADEGGYQAYVDTSTWPGTMIVCGLIPHHVTDQDFAQSCRALADGAQRTDNLMDLAQDLRQGRMTFSAADLQRHGVTPRELHLGIHTPGVHALLMANIRAARAALDRASRMLDEITPAFAPSVRCLIGINQHRLDRVEDHGTAITLTPVREDPLACLRLLITARTPLTT
ncbi:squalene/phytoene synthase family protein [Streptomyces sp. NPDC005752]|uniref:squalene/phytoene synthase family protein n=1 Tax=Streptomyces sp. NPDC005752 TaxID=3157065 RepID=UPI0033D05EE6